jgi:hypothetical protein
MLDGGVLPVLMVLLFPNAGADGVVTQAKERAKNDDGIRPAD